MTPIRNPKQVARKGTAHQVAETGPSLYEVVSGTSGNVYRVWVGPEHIAHCSCSWGQYRRSGAGSGCSHVIAVHAYRAAQDARRVSAWAADDIETIRRQHRATIGIGDGVVLTLRRT
jgi:predicted nucleic acid-binding Zn finger protein